MQVHRLVRLGAITVMVASLGTLTGCELNPFEDAGSGMPTVNLERAGRMLSQADVKRFVPAGASAPSGYAVERTNLLQPKRSGRHKTTPARCDVVTLGIDADFLKSPTRSYSTYVNSEKSFLGVGVGSTASTPKGLSGPIAALDSCGRFVVRTGKQTIRTTATALPFPKMGEQSFAVRYTLRGPGLAATYDAVRIRVGHNTVVVDALAVGKKLPVTAELEGAAHTVLLALSR